MSTSSTKTTVKALRDALNVRPPYCSGFCPIPADELALYYGQDENARLVVTSSTTIVHMTNDSMIYLSAISISPRPLVLS
jgi:hypothetical protein